MQNITRKLADLTIIIAIAVLGGLSAFVTYTVGQVVELRNLQFIHDQTLNIYFAQLNVVSGLATHVDLMPPQIISDLSALSLSKEIDIVLNNQQLIANAFILDHIISQPQEVLLTDANGEMLGTSNEYAQPESLSDLNNQLSYAKSNQRSLQQLQFKHDSSSVPAALITQLNSQADRLSELETTEIQLQNDNDQLTATALAIPFTITDLLLIVLLAYRFTSSNRK